MYIYVYIYVYVCVCVCVCVCLCDHYSQLLGKLDLLHITSVIVTLSIEFATFKTSVFIQRLTLPSELYSVIKAYKITGCHRVTDIFKGMRRNVAIWVSVTFH